MGFHRHGAWHARGNATITNNALMLPGTSGNYVNLPADWFAAPARLRLNSGPPLPQMETGRPSLTLGTSPARMAKLSRFSPHASANSVELQSTTTDGTLTITSPETFDNLSLHVVCIIDPANGYGTIYTNGVLLCAATNTTPLLNSISAAWSFIGRSLLPQTPGSTRRLTSFALRRPPHTAEIAANNQFGPGATSLPISLAVAAGVSNITLSWPSYAVGYAAESSPTLARALCGLRSVVRQRSPAINGADVAGDKQGNFLPFDEMIFQS